MKVIKKCPPLPVHSPVVVEPKNEAHFRSSTTLNERMITRIISMIRILRGMTRMIKSEDIFTRVQCAAEIDHLGATRVLPQTKSLKNRFFQQEEEQTYK